MTVYTLHFDGSCWPNPGGDAGCGFTLHKNGELVAHEAICIGSGPDMSNNLAEYVGLKKGLLYFGTLEYERPCTLQVKGDSQLVINQMNKKWKIKEGLYTEHAYAVRNIVKHLRKHNVIIMFDWIPRNKNEECDKLSKSYER